jgi:hypothetical protein
MFSRKYFISDRFMKFGGLSRPSAHPFFRVAGRPRSLG